MSYSQIFRRISRILQSKINNAIDSFSTDDQDEKDFDDALNGKKTGSSQNSTSQQQYQQARASGKRGSSTSSGKQQAHQEGKRKPGEKPDAHYYAVLGLTPDASVEEIKKAYRKLMSMYHPDRVSSLGAELQKAAAEKAKAINEAFMIIERRRNFK